MRQDRLPFRVTHLTATVPEGVAVEWQGQPFASGPLLIDLDDTADEHGNTGVLDYVERRARAEFRVRLQFPVFAGMLESLGVDPALTQPVRAILRSEGEILDDHSFALSGRCELQPHSLLAPERTEAAVLPGR